MSEQTFSVDKVLKARVDKGGKGKKYWWEGYSERDATWQVEEDFLGSKWSIKTFWQHANVGKRDPTRFSQFKLGEIISLRESSVAENSQRAGPGRSSAALVTKVFALWPEDQLYYTALVQRRNYGSKYTVRFTDDDSESVVSLKEMRLCSQLRPSDTVIAAEDSITVSSIGNNGYIVLKKKIKIEDVRISSLAVATEWGDRTLSHEDIITASG
ncbi:hypothetical protein B0H11DRAFT_2187809 [Mycena galericulata]|nr:hypothetical protein B0H11DRAFT_2187809 [Mycena galericulata]